MQLHSILTIFKESRDILETPNITILNCSMWVHAYLWPVCVGNCTQFGFFPVLLKIMVADALQRRLNGKGVTMSAVNPGIVSVFLIFVFCINIIFVVKWD